MKNEPRIRADLETEVPITLLPIEVTEAVSKPVFACETKPDLPTPDNVGPIASSILESDDNAVSSRGVPCDCGHPAKHEKLDATLSSHKALALAIEPIEEQTTRRHGNRPLVLSPAPP